MRISEFDSSLCPVARTVERAGDMWSLMILRDALHGLTRFDQFRKSLGVAPNILADRLTRLVEAGFLQRRPYSRRPPRDEYVLTEMGRDFRPVLYAIMAFGNRHFAKEGLASGLVDTETGAQAEPVVVDARTGRRVDDGSFALAAGPAADEPMLARMAFVAHAAEAGRL
ncbi:helix-turn-helix domain-containing protein [Phenylobacterium sp.]|jgi:DNA-binding HxlR family transcriptional regulator|uniref:winged helix-turn-helix transcriptional regulator n=1 Tax=Phenylobacterium sp. TaxID=1871053 RepID=UPI002E33EFF5|nr:helix-turn-helix domain-containing protein [Phenylobacterium sp.]HEX3367907.1 helix-turn-helix domain-containing protein [Phenylobacterium sp.]